MKFAGKPLAVGVALSVMATATVFAQEEGSANPYEAIWVRNSFGLKPPPPPPTPPAPVVEKPASNVKLAGFTSIVSPRKALFVVQEANGKTEYPVLAEGEKLNGLEVISIDEENETVLVVSGGEEIKMGFDTHGLKPSAAPPPLTPGAVPGQPGVMAVPGVPMAQPPGQNIQPVPIQYNPPVQTQPLQPQSQPGSIRPLNSAPGGQMPARPVRTSMANPQGQGQVIDHTPKGAPMTVEQAELLIQVNKAIQPKDYPPLPGD